MAANTLPIYPKTPNISWTILTTANTANDGTGTAPAIFTAGPDGSRIDKIRIKHLGTNIQTCLQLFINNGLTNATAANNILYAEKTITANTASLTTASLDEEYDLDIALPSGYKMLAVINTAIVAGIAITAIGGDY